MFNSITWGQYFSIMALLLICYYAVVAFRYFRWEILNLAGIKKVKDTSISTIPLPPIENMEEPNNQEDYLPKSVVVTDISPWVQTFKDEVQAYFMEDDNIPIQKKEILNSLQTIASKYPAVKNADCQNELEQFVLTEANLKYPHLLHSNDITPLWN